MRALLFIYLRTHRARTASLKFGYCSRVPAVFLSEDMAAPGAAAEVQVEVEVRGGALERGTGGGGGRRKPQGWKCMPFILGTFHKFSSTTRFHFHISRSALVCFFISTCCACVRFIWIKVTRLSDLQLNIHL